MAGAFEARTDTRHVGKGAQDVANAGPHGLEGNIRVIVVDEHHADRGESHVHDNGQT